MRILLRIFGWPHELIHVLALLLIGRKPLLVRQTHVIIPDDLSTRQYIFVAGMPAFVFLALFAVAVQALFAADNIREAVVWLLVISITGLAGVGTLGDVQLIVLRLTMTRQAPPQEVILNGDDDESEHTEQS
ncbi:MAG: hypothetical protein D6737_08435 [Chloroflexi bacterium]|nr:MAG: hypothetical protein D6737_08435 [Chloroflexota bacterium]